MNILNWKYANRVSITFGILGGLYLLFSFLSPYINKEYELEATIQIDKFKLPQKLNYSSLYGKIEKNIPIELERNQLAYIIVDSLLKDFNMTNISNDKFAQYKNTRYDIKDVISESIPVEIDYYDLRKRIDSAFWSLIYPLDDTQYYVETSLENTGKKLAKNVRLEIPSSGYFELYENNNLINQSDYTNKILIGDVRVKNKFLLKIWSFESVTPYDKYSPNGVRYNFDNGSVEPKIIETIVNEGIKYWIYKNTFLFFYILFVIAWFIIQLKYYFKSNSGEELEENK